MKRAPWRSRSRASAWWTNHATASWSSAKRLATRPQIRLRGRKNSHIIALDVGKYISADQPADAILRDIRRQEALSIACHPHHRTARRIEISTCYLWDHRDELSDLVDVWEAANRDDLFSVTSLKHFPYMANSDFHKPKHFSWYVLVIFEAGRPLVGPRNRGRQAVVCTTGSVETVHESWKTLLRCEKNWPAVKAALRSNVDVALTLFRNGSWAA
jgi:3',5'-nucleoside bisphosphate phosphatase